MMGFEKPDETLAAQLEAYRAAAHAEADGHFDDRALEAQRQRILARLEQAGHPARVLRFPGVPSAVRPVNGISRRWISAAAAAGLLIGLMSGQLLHVMPGDAWGHRDVAPVPVAAPAERMTAVPVLAASAMDDDDALLDAIDLAVSRRGASELRVLDDLTFAYEPR